MQMDDLVGSRWSVELVEELILVGVVDDFGKLVELKKSVGWGLRI